MKAIPPAIPSIVMTTRVSASEKPALLNARLFIQVDYAAMHVPCDALRSGNTRDARTRLKTVENGTVYGV